MRPPLYAICLVLSSLVNAEQATYPPDTCTNLLPNHALNLQEVVNLALCNNPQTREIWANVQAQAALVSVSKASEFPSIALNA